MMTYYLIFSAFTLGNFYTCDLPVPPLTWWIHTCKARIEHFMIFLTASLHVDNDPGRVEDEEGDDDVEEDQEQV